MAYFELIFMKGVRSVLNSFYCMWMSVPDTFVEKTILSPSNYLSLFVKDQLTIFMWVCFWVFYSVPLIYLSILSAIKHCLDYSSYSVSLKVR